MRLLTEHELEILSLQTCGLSYQEIADELGITESTVKNIMVTIRKKLGAKTQVQAISMVIPELFASWKILPVFHLPSVGLVTVLPQSEDMEVLFAKGLRPSRVIEVNTKNMRVLRGQGYICSTVAIGS
jgi:DNA-binding CsgD family transcriptional regulator